MRSSLISRAGQLAFDQKGDRLAVVGSTPFVGAGIFIFETTKLDQSPIAVGQFGTGQRGDIEGLAIGAGTTMVSVDSAGTALEWDMVGSSPYTTDIAILDHQVDEMAASDDGSMIATLSWDDDRISLYDATFSTELSGFDVPDAGLIAVAGDGSRIAYSVADTVHVMDRGGTELAVVVPADGEEIGALALDATGTQLAVHSYTFAIGPFTAAPGDGRLSVFSVSNGQRVSGPWPAGGEVVGLGWTADGTGLQGIDGGSSVVVWSLADGSPSTSPIDLDVTMHALALDRSRALFVAGVPGEGIYLFDARTPGGLQLGLIASHPGGVAFDHSGRVYAGSTLIPTVTVTEVGTQRWIEMACSMANRSLTPDEAVRYIGDGKSATACTGG